MLHKYQMFSCDNLCRVLVLFLSFGIGKVKYFFIDYVISVVLSCFFNIYVCNCVNIYVHDVFFCESELFLEIQINAIDQNVIIRLQLKVRLKLNGNWNVHDQNVSNWMTIRISLTCKWKLKCLGSKSRLTEIKCLGLKSRLTEFKCLGTKSRLNAFKQNLLNWITIRLSSIKMSAWKTEGVSCWKVDRRKKLKSKFWVEMAHRIFEANLKLLHICILKEAIWNPKTPNYKTPI